jgi:hypothetical protein
MFYFDFPHFSPTQARSVATKIVFYDESLKYYLIEAAVFINNITQEAKQFPLNKFIHAVKLMHEVTKSDDLEKLNALSIEELIERISYVSDPIDKAFFNSEQDFHNNFSGTILLAERFQSSVEMSNAGSSRHLFLKGIDIKGAGRNKFAQRMDYGHSSGRATLNELLQDLFYGHLIDLSLPLGAEKVCALANISNSENYICFRSRTSVRLCNATVKLKFINSTLKFKALVSSFHSEANLLRAHFINLTSGLLNGLRHGALNGENALVCGKLIDCQTLIVEPQVNTFHFSIQIMCLKIEAEMDFDNLADAIDKSPNDFVIKHNDCFNYVDYFDMLQMALSQNANWVCENSVDLWAKCLEEDFEITNTKSMKKSLNILSSLTPGLQTKSIKILNDLPSDTELDCIFDQKTQNFILEVRLLTTCELDEELNNFKLQRLQNIPARLKATQTIMATSLKFGLPYSKVSKDLLELIKKSSLVPHYIYINNFPIRNTFTTSEVTNLLLGLGGNLLDKHEAIDLTTGDSSYILLKDIDLFKSSMLLLATITCDFGMLAKILYVRP